MRRGSGIIGAQWNTLRAKLAGTREVPYLESTITLNGWDLEQRGRQALQDESQLPASVRLWRAASRLGPNLVVDVGANVGAFVLAGRYGGRTRCFAFEPNPDIVACLGQSVGTHPDAARITLRRAAVSDQAGTIEFNIDTLKSGCSSIHASPRFRGPTKTITADLVRLDDVIPFAGTAPFLLIKTDTEGNDFRVLKGAEHLLASSTRVIGFCEFAPDLLGAAGTSPGEFLRLLSGRFHLWWVHDKPAARLEAIPSTAYASAASWTGNLVYSNDADSVLSLAADVGVPVE